jgi:hypothetical protein
MLQREGEMVKRLMWSGLLAGLGWRRVFDEEPPE